MIVKIICSIKRLTNAVRDHRPYRHAQLMLALIAILDFACSSMGQPRQFDWKPVEEAIGKAGSVQPDGVYKIALPRTDLHVKVGDVEVKPALALGSWIAFRKLATEAIVMGDLVLTEDEVGPIMAKLEEESIEITALHNHLLNDSPHLFFMHFWANDDALKLARGLRAALDKTNSAK